VTRSPVGPNGENRLATRKILITGGAGFIGCNLTPYLLGNTDSKIAVLDNESLGKRKFLEGSDVEFINADIKDRAALRKIMKGTDVVIHLAADTTVIGSFENPSHNFTENVIGTFGLLEEARSAGVKQVINASTGGAILGEAEPPIDESMVAAPVSPYGASKLAVEGYCSAYSGSYGMRIASLRFSNIYGPRSFHKGSVVAHYFKQILVNRDLVVYGDGTQVRDYLYVGDLVVAIRQVIEQEATGVYQLGSGNPTSINGLIDLIQGVVGEQRALRVAYELARPGEVYKTWCNIDKAVNHIAFNPVTSLSQGLEETWAWFQKDRSAESVVT